MTNALLTSVQAKLKNYFTYFKIDNILAVAEDNVSPPFAYLICDEKHPKKILISIAVDYPNACNVADVILKARKLKLVAQTEPFYICNLDGVSYFGDDATYKWELENLDLQDIMPISDYKH